MAIRYRAGVGRLATVRRSALPLLLSGLTFAALAACPALAQSPSPARVGTADPNAAYIAEASQRFGIPQTWIVAVKRAESRSDVRAVSPAGALGRLGVHHSRDELARVAFRIHAQRGACDLIQGRPDVRHGALLL